jgi:glutamyl-tRNA reductase
VRYSGVALLDKTGLSGVRTSSDKGPSRFPHPSVEGPVSAISLPHLGPVGEPSSTRDSQGGSGPVATPFLLFGLEFSLDTAPLDSLEQLTRAVTRERLQEWFARIDGTEEVALLTTCHRVELTLLLRTAEDLQRWRALLPGPRNSWRVREGRAVVSHLFRVAAGRESLARGEGEVRHQVRSSGHRVESRHPRRVLQELFARASDAADELAPSVPTSQSIAAVAVARLMTLVDLPQPKVLVIGSGTVGRQVTESLGSKAAVTVLYHRNPPEAAWLESVGARAAPLDQLGVGLAHADAAVTAAKFGDRGLRAADLPRDHPLLLIDLGMPRNIDPDVRELPNVRLVDLEDLHASGQRACPTDEGDERLEALADRCSDRLEPLLLEPWVGVLRRAAEELRRSELAQARPFLGELDREQELALERLTQRLVAHLLQPPTERIRSLPPGSDGDLQRRWALELLRPVVRDP